MLAQGHYRFRKLVEYKMARAGGRSVECGEEYTSKMCSSPCDHIKHDLMDAKTYRCDACSTVLDRDLNAARNILHKNLSLLQTPRQRHQYGGGGASHPDKR
ncbi:hypothetical protein PybrP1_006962 [[Pythium] brassicae (nom. inval.)]|nr:hypothetical protein PybrP1_006962 [[Pythium] brassicae (nom. inval.)]